MSPTLQVDSLPSEPPGKPPPLQYRVTEGKMGKDDFNPSMINCVL